MARLHISFAVSNLPIQINACNKSARTLAERPTRPKYSSNHIIMLHCYSNAAINKKEVYLHYIPRDIPHSTDISTKHIAQPIYHTEKQAAQLCQYIILGEPQFYFLCVDSKCTPRNYDHNDKNWKKYEHRVRNDHGIENNAKRR